MSKKSPEMTKTRKEDRGKNSLDPPQWLLDWTTPLLIEK